MQNLMHFRKQIYRIDIIFWNISVWIPERILQKSDSKHLFWLLCQEHNISFLCLFCFKILRSNNFSKFQKKNENFSLHLTAFSLSWMTGHNLAVHKNEKRKEKEAYRNFHSHSYLNVKLNWRLLHDALQTWTYFTS